MRLSDVGVSRHAKSVKVLCDALGVWCVIAISSNNPEKGIKYRHTWNIVQIAGTVVIWMPHLTRHWENIGNAEAPGEIPLRFV